MRDSSFLKDLTLSFLNSAHLYWHSMMSNPLLEFVAAGMEEVEHEEAAPVVTMPGKFSSP